MAGGRPLKFKSLDLLQKEVDRYFKENNKEEWTITGLAVWLDTSRFTLMQYENGEGQREEFSNTIKAAKEKVAAEYERRGWNEKNQSFAIFAMKNMGWSDKQEHEMSGPNGGPFQHKNVAKDIGSMTDEEVLENLQDRIMKK